MENSNSGEEDKMHTASGVTEGLSQDRREADNEAVESFRRGDRKGRSVAARLAGEPDGSPAAAQTAQGLLPSSSTEPQEHHRIIISAEASRLLDELSSKVNVGFEAGKATRPQILNWLIKRFCEICGEEEIGELRAAFFDRIAYLETLLKRAKETGYLPPELNAAIQVPKSITQDPRKKKRPA